MKLETQPKPSNGIHYGGEEIERDLNEEEIRRMREEIEQMRFAVTKFKQEKIEQKS